MILKDVIYKAQQFLTNKDLEPNVAFKILFFLDKRINHLNDYIKYQNQKINWFFYIRYIHYLNAYIKKQKPLAYLFQNIYFFDHDFIVLKNVHIPKMESEGIVKIANEFINKFNFKDVLDLCCGTGVLGISLLLNSDINLTLIDKYQKAILNTRKNLQKHNLKANVIKNDLLKNINCKYDLIICNPPYISFDDKNIDFSVKKFENKKAIYAKNNGLFFYQEIIPNAHLYLNQNGILILEMGYNQKSFIKSIIINNNHIKKYEFIKDIYDRDRIVVVYF